MRLLPNRCAAVATVTLFFVFVLSYSGMAFPIPERLEFEISYAGIPAGRATHQVSRVGKEVVIVATARSADWLKHFFPVEDRVESVLAPAIPPRLFGTSRLYSERVREGRKRYLKDALFDRQKLTVATRDFVKNSERVQKITPQTHDMLSAFFHVRMIPLQVGASTFVDIFDCKRLWNTEVQVLGREEIEIPLGRFRTIVIKPLLKTDEGFFARTADMIIWLSDDDRRIPVQMKSRLRIGSITVTLVGGNYWPEKK